MDVKKPSKSKLLISACLLGKKVKYNGGDNLIDLSKLQDLVEFIPCCPEVDGGLPTPRAPSEVQGDKVVNIHGKDVTKEFQKGANIALFLAKQHNIKYALLKSKSPSCGNDYIYDGTFSTKLIQSKGITARVLEAGGIKVFNENEIDELLAALKGSDGE